VSAPPPPDPAITFFADFLFKNLISSTRAEDVGLSFYARELTKQKATESDFRLVSLTAATHFVHKLEETNRSGGKPLTEDAQYALLKESLESALKEYGKRTR
jgi:hypothetical protein